MPFVTFAERYGREKAFEDAIESVLEIRFPETVQSWMPRIRSIGDGDRLQHLHKLILLASASEIEAELPNQ